MASAKVTLVVVTSGHSGAPTATKIGVKEGHRVTLLGAPRAWSIEDIPSNVRVSRRRSGSQADVVIAFFSDAAAFERDVASLSETVTPYGSPWIAWPRRAAGHRSDITANVVCNAVLPLGLVDVKVAVLDEDWSALKMMRRKELRHDLR